MLLCLQNAAQEVNSTSTAHFEWHWCLSGFSTGRPSPSFVINNCLELILRGCLSYFPTVLANQDHLALPRWPFQRQLIMWSPSMVILNSNTFHLHLKNNFHSSPSLSFKILLSNLHGLMGSLYSTYCYLVLTFFLMLTFLPLWFIEWIPSMLDPLSLWCVPWLARYLFGFSFWERISCIDQAESWLLILLPPVSQELGWQTWPPPASPHPLHASLLSGTVGQVQAVLVLSLPWFWDQPFFLLVENRIWFLFKRIGISFQEQAFRSTVCLPLNVDFTHQPGLHLQKAWSSLPSFLWSIAKSSSVSFS